jgi:hypothetical protein
MGHGKDIVEVWDRQKILQPLVNPLMHGFTLALRTVTIPTGIIDRDLIPTLT